MKNLFRRDNLILLVVFVFLFCLLKITFFGIDLDIGNQSNDSAMKTKGDYDSELHLDID